MLIQIGPIPMRLHSPIPMLMSMIHLPWLCMITVSGVVLAAGQNGEILTVRCCGQDAHAA